MASHLVGTGPNGFQAGVGLYVGKYCSVKVRQKPADAIDQTSADKTGIRHQHDALSAKAAHFVRKGGYGAPAVDDPGNGPEDLW